MLKASASLSLHQQSLDGPLNVAAGILLSWQSKMGLLAQEKIADDVHVASLLRPGWRGS